MNKTLLNKVISLTNGHSFYKNYDFFNWDSIPILSKYDVLQNYSDIIGDIDNYPHYITRTSGSSGTILNIPWLMKDSLFSVKQLWECRQKYGIAVSDSYVTCHANYYSGNELIENKIIINKNCHSLSKLHMSTDDLCVYANHIINLNPSWMMLQPSVAYSLGFFMYSNNMKINNLKLIELTGEKTTPELSTIISNYFGGTTVTNNYGMQEFQGIAYGMAKEEYLECLNDNAYVEILDSENKAVPEGENGRIIVTGLTNGAFPLVRYDTGDIGSIKKIDKKTHLYVSESRANDAFVVNGKSYDASIFFNIIEHLNSNGNNIIQFQFFYDGKNLSSLLYSNNPFYSKEEIAHSIEQLLMSKYGIIMPNINVSFVRDFVKPQENNKFKYFMQKTISM